MKVALVRPFIYLGTTVMIAALTLPSLSSALSFGEFPSLLRPKAEASVGGGKSTVQTMPVLKAAMNRDPNPAKGGGEVIIEDGVAVRASGGLAGETVVPEKDAISIYVVREGDTLSEIARMFEVSVNTIIWANDLPRAGTIREGQLLTILPVSGVRYSVKKGDTIASIAKQFKGDAEEIEQFNGLSGALAVGDTIIIPNGQEIFEPAPVKKSSGVSVSTSPSYSGYYTNPLPGGRRTQGIHGTNGVDLAAPRGTPIVAAAGGDVIVAFEGGWNGGYGSYVVIRHPNGTQTLYAHMSSVDVGKGQSVRQGQVIGYVGNTGRSSGPHLHFEIRGGPRNPF